MAEDERARRIAEKYKRTPEQLAQDIVKMEEAKKRLTQNSQELDANLKHFHELLDPIIDPNTGQAMCWVRRPSMAEWESMTPPELLKYKDPSEIPQEVREKYKNHQFEMMEKLITNPAHDASWWKENTDMLFQEMFQLHLLDVYRKLGMMVENF